MAELFGTDRMKDWDEIEEQNFEPLPAGWYDMMVTESEMKTSKAGNDYLAITLSGIADNCTNKKVFMNLNLFHHNETVSRIAQQQLKQLCQAAGVERPKDSSEIHDIPVLVKLVIEEDENYGAKNIAKGFKPAEQAQLAQKTVEGDTPPWQK